MTTSFSLRLIDAPVPEGQIDVDDAVAILGKLQELSTRIARVETDAASRGRPDRSVDRAGRLRLISIHSGSTVIDVERVVDGEALELELDDERRTAERFAEIIDAIGDDRRPPEVSDSIAATAADLVGALKRAAPRIEFSVNGRIRRRFDTAGIHRETWQGSAESAGRTTTIVGRLVVGNLKSHRFQVQDDVGNEYGLPLVDNDDEVGPLLGSYVRVTGVPDADSRIIRDAKVTRTRDTVAATVPGTVTLSTILASAPGPEMGGIRGLGDAEAAEFLRALKG